MMCEAESKPYATGAPANSGCVLAGVDLGTLTCRLLIARVSGDRMTELLSERRILRLGEGVATEGRLREDAMTRVLRVLEDWRRTIEAQGVLAEAAVATSAVRDASNRTDFLRRAQACARFEVEVLSGEEEARRTMLGIRAGVPLGVEHMLGIDIGGGSTELIADRPGQTPVVQSLNLGVVRATELLLRHDPPTREELQRTRHLVKELVLQARPVLGDFSRTTLVGTAGTITTLAAMAQGLAQYTRARIHNYVLELDCIRSLEQTLLERRTDERAAMVGLEPGRKDVIAAGTVILRTVMETLGFRECLVSDLGLREGIVLNLAQEKFGVHGARFN